MISTPLYQRVEFTFPAPGELAGLNPFGVQVETSHPQVQTLKERTDAEPAGAGDALQRA